VENKSFATFKRQYLYKKGIGDTFIVTIDGSGLLLMTNRKSYNLG